MAAVSAEGSTVWVLIRRLNSSWSRSIALVVRALFHLADGQSGKGEQPVTSLLEAVGYRFAFEPPFADEGPPVRLDFRSGGGVDHVVVVGRDLLVQPMGRVSEQVAVLVDRAALGRYVAPEGGQRLLQPSAAVDNQKLWLAQPALEEIIENRAPRLAGLAAHVLEGQPQLLAVVAHAEHDQEHDRGGLAVEPDPHHGAIQDQADDRPMAIVTGKVTTHAITMRQTMLLLRPPPRSPRSPAIMPAIPAVTICVVLTGMPENPAGRGTVRRIFALYRELGCVRRVKEGGGPARAED